MDDRIHAVKELPRTERGFSLVELMVVIVIIGILGSVVAINVFPQIFKAKRTKAMEDIRTLERAVELYAQDYNGTLPENLENLLEEPPYGGGAYIKGGVVPLDPWGNEYKYEQLDYGQFRIASFGADGVEGGTGPDEDIDSQTMNQNAAEQQRLR